MKEEILEVGSDLVTANQRAVSSDQSEASVEGQEDVMTGVVRRQEAALRRLEAKHGSGYGKPPPGSESEARARKYNENCVRSVFVGSVAQGMLITKGRDVGRSQFCAASVYLR